MLNIKEKILDILELVKRPKNKLKNFILETDFFTAPASRNHHLNIKGGLALHTWNVYNIFRLLIQDIDPKYNNQYDSDTIILLPICHDLCKVNFYKPVYKKLNENQDIQMQWEIQDNFPIGHGEKSSLIASRLIDLTEEELLAIRWHSGIYEVSIANQSSWFLALRKTPLVSMLFLADFYSTFVVESHGYSLKEKEINYV